MVMETELVDIEPQLVVMERRVIKMDEMPSFFDRVFPEIVGAVEQAGGTLVGPPFGWYHGRPTDSVDVAAGFPVAGVPEGSLGGDLVAVERPGGRAVTTVHVGPYDTLAQTYEQLEQHLTETPGLGVRDSMWEEYVTDPSAEPDTSKWQTRIVVPLD
jgi:effector-binding domain-containing protein